MSLVPSVHLQPASLVWLLCLRLSFPACSVPIVCLAARYVLHQYVEIFHFLSHREPRTINDSIVVQHFFQRKGVIFTAKDKNTVIRKICFDDSAIPTRPTLRSVPAPRPKNPFIDDSAIESDGEGGDISSTATTPEKIPFIPISSALPKPPPLRSIPLFRSIPPPPPPPPTRFLATPRIVKEISKPVCCDLCGLRVSSKAQLPHHRNTRRCTARQNYNTLTSPCKVCNRKFNNIHDRKKHFRSKHSELSSLLAKLPSILTN